MNLKITMVGDKETAQAFKRLGDNMTGKKMLPAALSGALILRNRMKELVSKLTGTLSRSIHIGNHTSYDPVDVFRPSEGPGYSDIGGTIVVPGGVRVEVGTNLVYAAIQEFGGTIRAKDKPYLVFKTKDGSWHSVKSVQIPPRAYMRGAFLEKKPDVIQEIDLALDAMIRGALK